MSLSLSVAPGITSHTCSITVIMFMAQVSCIWIGIELPSFSGGEHEEVPCKGKTKEQRNNSMQPGSLHLSRTVSKRALEIPIAAVPAVCTSKLLLSASGHPFPTSESQTQIANPSPRPTGPTLPYPMRISRSGTRTSVKYSLSHFMGKVGPRMLPMASVASATWKFSTHPGRGT